MALLAEEKNARERRTGESSADEVEPVIPDA
jgi:hypothetical protein